MRDNTGGIGSDKRMVDSAGKNAPGTIEGGERNEEIMRCVNRVRAGAKKWELDLSGGGSFADKRYVEYRK